MGETVPHPTGRYPVPPVLRPPRRGRPWVHLLLFLSTTLTVGYVGWYMEGGHLQIESWSDFLPSFRRFFTPSGLWRALPYTLSILGILGAHEMGHYLACRYYRIPATLPYFIPGPVFGTFGAVIRIRGIIPHRRALFDIAAAGPLAGFAVAVPILFLGILGAEPVPSVPPEAGFGYGDSLLSRWLWSALQGRGSFEVGSVFVAGWFGLLVTSMNLFPVGQLDGGHLAYSISRKLHRVLSWATFLGLVVLVLGNLVLERSPSVYTLWCVILFLMRDRHPRLAREDLSLGAGRRLLSLVLFLVFLLTFMPIPIVFLS